MLPHPREEWERFLAFLDLGGEVMLGLFFVAFLMWTLILERYAYLWLRHPRRVREVETIWKARGDRASWYAQRIREKLISECQVELRGPLLMMRNLVVVCPLLGLLGTVTGMLNVFHVMAVSGNANVRAMASGVSEAIISTLAGMVVALSGLYFVERFRRRVIHARRQLEDRLV